ncbi:FecR domain-containing protein [Desulforhopalus sp. IMCC35007]|uniref:FecR domain-containing protein n=1 Tax=Desulforhopalus sp. IMCC35007 TaxID=2569543 RepID=UPI00145C50FE|nr:FecR domain-containing protein [Desulforhopalus sp. IMCC35007]
MAPIELLKVEKVSARVASVIGGVFIVSNGKKLQRVSQGDLIMPGQTLVTEDDGFTHLIFPDNKYTRISSGSKFTLTYLVKLSDNSLKAEFFLEKGRITHAVKKQLKANETFTTRTPVSVTGVRGTEYRLKVTDDNVNIVETLQGVVQVAGEKGELSLPKGMGTKVEAGRRPRAPKTLPAAPETPVISDIVKELPVKIPSPSAGNGVALYHLRVTTDEQGYNTVLAKTAKSGAFFTLLALADGNYFGFLTAIDEEGFESQAARPFSFQVRTIPGAPIFVSARKGKAVFDQSLKVEWLQGEGQQSYNLQLAIDDQFSELLVDVVQNDNSFTFENLAPGTYYCRVQSIASDGFRSLFSLVDTWKVQQQTSFGPLEGSSKDGVNLRWASMGEDIVYEVQMSRKTDFSDLVISEKNLQNPEFSYNESMDPGTYYVRVRGVLSDGQMSPWTPSQKLKIAQAPFAIVDGIVLTLFLSLILIL